ncbi:MAG: cadherin-like domain-containing protein [Deltaproteobacteria bacterium]|nr:cadherin-like domain-containing protein [Deltaproteobacteria bacterium]
MQHVYKETFLFFHGPKVSNEKLISLAKTFQYHPVATLPARWYKETQVTLDMGGLIPLNKKIAKEDRRKKVAKKSQHKKAAKKDQRVPVYSKGAFNTKNAYNYNFGWNQFLVDVMRKWAAGQGGGWPYSVSALIATENPADYYFAEQFAMGELNVRPHWMAGYVFDRDWKFLQLTENPYGGVSWRKIKGGKFKRHFDASFLKGTDIDARPRDDEHAWFYHMEEAYYFTANPWIKDWYKFVAEFRKTRLNHLDPFTDNTTRATAHSLAHALQAYRVTGDTKIIELFRDYINKWLRTDQDPYNGGRISQRRMKTPWAGFLSRAIISFMEEVRGKDCQAHAEAFNFLSGLMEWNYHFSNFSWRVNVSKGEIGTSSPWSQHFADPQAWYFLHTGKQKYLDHLNQYVDKGINGGEKAQRSVRKWNGEFMGRYVQFVRENQKADLTPPNAILDLRALIKGPGIELAWTAPEEAARYHIVWSDKPISEETIIDKRLTNWWAANPVGTDLLPIPGSKQCITIRPSKIKPFYVAIFSFDGNDNMSPMSNVAMAFQIQGDLSYPPNIPPLASDGSLTTATGTPFSGTLSAIDPDKDVLTYMIVSNGSSGTVTLTDATTGTYTYTPNANATGTDMFTFKVSDGDAYSDVATVTVKIIPKKRFEGDLIFEIGEVDVNHNWMRVSFIKAFNDPVIVAKPVAYNGSNPCVARIRNMDATGFDIRLQEWEYLDGKHALETVNYMAVERGSYVLSDGICIEAGRFNTDKTGSFKMVAFGQSFRVAPVVIASVSSFNGRDAVTGRLQNIGPKDFEFMMQEQESNAQKHKIETISYIAWEPSSGTLGDLTFEVHRVDDVVDSRWKPVVFQRTFTKPPLFLADIQTTEGIETATLRYQKKDAGKVEVKIEEEQSKDKEMDHTIEVLGYVVFAFED